MRFCSSNKVIALFAALVLPVALRAVTENPVVRLHGQDLTFLLTFDDGTAQPDVGLVENLKHKRFETMEKGFLGRAMSAGSLRFPHPAGSRAVDMTRPGTLIMWVQLRRAPTPDKTEPSQSFVVWDMGRDKTMVLMKQGAMRWGEGIMSLHYTGGGKGMRFVKSVSTPAPVTMWKPGAWRMLVATWTPEKIGISLDGEPVKEVVYDRKFGPFTGAFEINAGGLDVPDAERIFAVDEVAVLSRRLSDAEIKALHGAFFHRDVWVDNVKGDDAAEGTKDRPVRTLAAAARKMSAGDVMNLVPNAEPYREQFNAGQHKNMAGTVIDGHGAVFDGRLVHPRGEWKDEGDGVWSIRCPNNAWVMDDQGYWSGHDIVFKGEVPLKWRKSREALEDDTYYLLKVFNPKKNDRKGVHNTLYLKLSRGEDPESAKVSFPSLNYAINVETIDDITVRNVTGTYCYGDAFDSAISKGVRFENVRGAFCMDQGISAHATEATIVNSRFDHNAGCGSVDCGAGIRRATVAYSNCVFACDSFRGGVEVQSGEFRFTDCVIRGNRGKGLKVSNFATAHLVGCTFDDAGAGAERALQVYDSSTCTVERCTFSGFKTPRTCGPGCDLRVLTAGGALPAILWTRPLVETDRYIGWPSAIRTAKGETIAVYSGDRDQHICPFGKVQMIRSADDGETWTKPVTVCDGPIDDRDAGLLELPNGDLVLFWFTSVAFAEGEPNRAKYRAECERTTDAEKRAALGSWARRSTDGGRTWSEPVRVPVMTPHGGVLLRDGRILVVGVSNYMTAGRLPRDLVRPAKAYGVAESTDGGRSFRLIGEVPRGQIAEHWSLGEPTLFESGDGVLHALFRYELDENGAWQKKTNMLRSESRDGGKTWTPMRRMEIDGFPPHVLRLRDGRFLCSYANRTPGRVGVYACFSSDDGKTFDVAHEVRLFSSGDNDLGYATTVENADGTFLTVFYAHGASGGPAKLFGTKWREK